jgi:hypothetical protein
MNFLIRLLALSFAVFVVSAEAKTIKYDLADIYSYPGYVVYPRLDLSNPKSAVLTLTKSAPLYETQLTSLEITFPTAAKFTATNFKLIEGNKYRAVVNGAWIYKEVVVEVEVFPLELRQAPIIRAYISERTAFINPQAEIPDMSALLFTIHGQLRDITPVRVIDNESILIGGKKVTLSLRDRIQLNAGPWTGTYIPDGFVVDVLWYGRGTKSIVIQAPVPPPEFDATEAVALVLSGTTDADRTISVKYKDRFGTELVTPPAQLKTLLDQAFGFVVP